MSFLDRLKLSFQCPANWDEMKGDDRKRYCAHCRKDVHNLSAMTRSEAEAVMAGKQEVCVRMERRADGSTVVKDCPSVGDARRTLSRIAGAGLAAGGALALPGCAGEEPAPVNRTPPPAEKQEQGEEIQLLGIVCPPERTGGS